MAEQISHSHAKNPNGEETQEGGCFHFLTKREEKKTEDDVVMADPNAAKESKEEKYTLMDELRRTHSHSTSSSDEEVEEGRGVRQKKKKKGLNEANEGKTSEGEDRVHMEKCSEEGNAEMGQPEEEKKGFLDKIKEKLPGQNKKGEDETQTPPAVVAGHSPGSDKKGILHKIKEKLPGHHKNNENEVKN